MIFSYLQNKLQVAGESDEPFRFKGCDLPSESYTFTTATNILYVYFNSSFFMTDTGFTLTFQQIKAEPSKFIFIFILNTNVCMQTV